MNNSKKEHFDTKCHGFGCEALIRNIRKKGIEPVHLTVKGATETRFQFCSVKCRDLFGFLIEWKTFGVKTEPNYAAKKYTEQELDTMKALIIDTLEG